MYLLDTNVVSELRKTRLGKAHPNVTAWVQPISAATMFLSVITIHEIEAGILRAQRRDASKGAVLRTWLEAQVFPAFAAGSGNSKGSRRSAFVGRLLKQRGDRRG